MTTSDLLTEAGAEVRRAAESATPNQAERILAGRSDDVRLALIVRLATALEAATKDAGPVSVLRFHKSYPGMTPLFHVYCSHHPEFGYCGEFDEAQAVADSHRAEHGISIPTFPWADADSLFASAVEMVSDPGPSVSYGVSQTLDLPESTVGA